MVIEHSFMNKSYTAKLVNLKFKTIWNRTVLCYSYMIVKKCKLITKVIVSD